MKKKKPIVAPADTRTPTPQTAEEIADARKLADASADERARKGIYRSLLMVALARLRAGRSLERAHGVVHPEVTAISRDVARFTELLFGRPAQQSAEGGAAAPAQAGPVAGETLASQALYKLALRMTPAALAKRAGVTAARLSALASGAEPPSPEEKAAFAQVGVIVDDWDRGA